MTSGARANKSAAEAGMIQFALRPAPVDPTLRPSLTSLLQALRNAATRACPPGARCEEADDAHRGLLRARRERPRRRAAEKRYELAPPYIEHGLPLRNPLGQLSAGVAIRRRARHAAGGGGGGGFGHLGGRVFGGLGCSMGQNSHLTSITSSARASSMGGTSMPSAFAVLRLITTRTWSEPAPAGRPASRP